MGETSARIVALFALGLFLYRVRLCQSLKTASSEMLSLVKQLLARWLNEQVVARWLDDIEEFHFNSESVIGIRNRRLREGIKKWRSWLAI